MKYRFAMAIMLCCLILIFSACGDVQISQAAQTSNVPSTVISSTVPQSKTTTTLQTAGNIAPDVYDSLDALEKNLASYTQTKGGEATPVCYYIPKNLPPDVPFTSATVRKFVYIGLDYGNGDYCYTQYITATPKEWFTEYLSREPEYTKLEYNGQMYYYYPCFHPQQPDVLWTHQFFYLTANETVFMMTNIPGNIPLEEALTYLEVEAVFVS
ncbi:MAG: hypothetical protein IKU55_06370 [Clostridia bacterium]|nr:hypothetical protein [Clostridia bacterium]